MTANTGSLFDTYPRLSRQERAIIARLREGPATNDDLAKIARKYTSRISACRQAGYQIDCVKQDYKTGVAIYELRTIA